MVRASAADEARAGWIRRLLVAATVLAGGCTCNNTEYTFPPPDPPGDPALFVPTSHGSWLSFDASPEGERLTMSYYDRDRGALGWAVGTPAGDTVTWLHERVDGYPDERGLDVRDSGKYSSQRTAPDGTVWIASHDATAGGLRIAHRIGPGTWEEPETIDGGSSLPGVGHYASLALDARGFPVVAHCDNGNGAVRLTRYDGSAWRTVQIYASRPFDTVDSSGNPITRPAGVAHTDLVIHGDELLVAVYDTASTSLHLLRGSDDAFEAEVVDDDGDVGAWPSLWTDGSQIWVAYQDVGREDLMFASRDGDGPWVREVVDDGELRGADTALVERDGAPLIVYFDGFDNNQWMASREGGSWQTMELGGADGAVGFHNEIVLAGGKWWAGSYDFTHNSLFLRPL